MYFDEFIQKLSQPSWPSLVLLYGDSEGVMAEGLTRLREAFRKRAPGGTVDVREGGEGDLAGLLAEAQTASLFADRRLLVLRGAGKALGGRSEAAQARLADYARDPNPDATVVFAAEGLRKTSKIVGWFEKNGWAAQCSDIPDWKLGPWVRQQARALGLELGDEGAQALLQKTGTDIAYLNRALEHLALFIHPARKPSLQDVLDLPIPGAEAEIFPFLDDWGMRRTEKALLGLRRMAPGAENGLVFMLYQRVRDLLGVAAGRAEGLDQSQLAQRLGIHPFRVKNLWEQSSQYTAGELRGALRDLVRIQAGLVTGRVGKSGLSTLVEWWIVKWGKNPLAAEAANGG
ncbi:MAG TPA: DNA polymerase III subunit delta [bacterium]|nr:DNA polymerase III subunit delta [bacterium]